MSRRLEPLPEVFVRAGFTQRSQFHVTANQVYVVTGIGVISGAVCYLVLDDTRMPSWVPAPLFEVVDSSVGPRWAYVYFHRDAQLPGIFDAMVADAEIALEEGFPDALMNRSPEALQRFVAIVERASQRP